MADIKLKDWTGVEHTYTGKRQLRVPGTDGNLVTFTQGNGEKDEEEKTVELDFSGAATQEVIPANGKVLSKVTVKKPETLIPGNIKKDVDIGGVTGVLEVAAVNLQTSKSVTITQNGTTNVVPDEGFDGMQSVDVNVICDGIYVDTFKMNSNGDYSTRLLGDIETSGQLSNNMAHTPGEVWLSFDFDAKVNGSFVSERVTLNWNFKKFKNLIYNGTNMYFSGEVVEEIQLDRINGKWTLAKGTVENVLAKIKDVYVQLIGVEDWEIVLNRIVMCMVVLD